jgi:hypothetical protein
MTASAGEATPPYAKKVIMQSRPVSNKHFQQIH